MKIKIMAKNGKTVIEVEGGKVKIKESGNKALTPRVYESPGQTRVLEPELMEEPALSPVSSEGLFQALWNIYREKTVLKSRLKAEKEIYKEYAETLTVKAEVMKLEKAILKETLEMKWLQDGKYPEMLEQKFLSNGIKPDREMLRESLLELLTELAEAGELDDE